MILRTFSLIFTDQKGSYLIVSHTCFTQTISKSTLKLDDLREGIERLSAVARAVSAWASDNALHLNTGKTKAIIFGSEHNINLLHELNLPGVEVQENVFVPFVDSVTNLGVMDSKLTWKQ